MALLKKTTKEQEEAKAETAKKPKAVKKAPKKTATKKAAVKEKTPVKKASAKKVVAKKDKKGISKKALQVMIRPLVTEKTAQLADNNVMVFEVGKDANRVEVKNAFNELYGVVPVKVNVMNMRGKRVAYGRVMGKRRDWKKAIITLPKGVNLDIFEGI